MAPPRNDPSAAKKEQNEYIPNFITKKPFYLDDDQNADYLEHQRLQKESESASNSKWYDRGKRAGPAATKFRKGACENCGSMTHKTKECLSRPRKQGAKWTGRDIQADELVQDVKLGWDAKRDRWNGYDAAEYRNVVSEYEELEELKRKAKGDDLQKLDGGEEGEDVGEDAKYEEETDMGRKQATSTRNLRIREDTAKYLLNLDLDSAKYDPKTRSMVDSGATADQAAALVAEEGFMRASGDAAEFERAQRYAWESQERGDRNKQHLQANPTSGEYFRRKEQEEAEKRREAHKKKLLEKYGGEQHVQKTPFKDAEVTENERYVEYDSTGAIKGALKETAKSKYVEDFYINNHTCVWGSWWENFKWGYECCHSTVKNSWCAGEEGKRAWEEAENIRTGGKLDAQLDTEEAADIDSEPSREQEDLAHDALNSKGKLPAPKRTLQEMIGGVQDEEMEEYRRKRTNASDPMAGLLGKDEVVH